MHRRVLLLAGCCSFAWGAQPACAQSTPEAVPSDSQNQTTPSGIGPGAQVDAAAAAANPTESIGDIIVTAQKRSEQLQKVPLAVSAFNQKSLELSGVREVQDLRLQVPNLSFSRTAVNSANVSIRGIGSTITSISADGGVGVHQNNAPLLSSRLVDADFFDVERVEVLRGPQGTLYGRNATGGVLNVITSKPTSKLSASVTGEYGNYDSKKVLGVLNVPLNDMFAARFAGIYYNRDGVARNYYTGRRADGRDLWAGRATLGFTPSSDLKAFLLYEHFNENDTRLRFTNIRCTPDPGPTNVGGVALANPVVRGLLSQGCKAASIYTAAARGTPNSFGTVYGPLGLATGLLSRDAFAGVQQPDDPRGFTSVIDPTYRARNDLVQLNVDWNVTPDLQASVLGSYSKDFFEARSDLYSGVATAGVFNTTALAPGGVLNDPQLGALSFPADVQISTKQVVQKSVEARLQSSFAGPVNFNVGGIYFKADAYQDFLLATNLFTAYSGVLNQGGANIYIDPLANPDRTGHNYLISHTPYALESYAGFGEVYWDITRTLKLTGGLRYTVDRKRQTDSSTLFTPGRGTTNPIDARATFKETTGKINISWQPDFSFTSSSLFYASYSKGYKGGGFNGVAGGVGTVPLTFAPEFVNAFEIGTKNTMLGGNLVVNLTGFLYNYNDYQIAKLVGVSAATENIDARVKGLELETILQPVRRLRLNGNLALLDTNIKNGLSVDPANPTAGDPAFTLVKAGSGNNCVVPTAALARILGGINAGAIPAPALLGVCTGSFATAGVTPSAGIATNLRGRQLPNAPRWTVNLGAQYTVDVTGDLSATLRGDYYRQGGSFAQIYNTDYDRLRGYDNVNMTLTFEHKVLNLDVQAFVRNLSNNNSIATTIQTNQLFGVFNQVFLVEPRSYGIRVTKRF